MEIYRNASYLLVLWFFSDIVGGNVMSNPIKYGVTNGFSRQTAIKYDGSLRDSDSMGHAGVIKCNIVTNVVRMCLRGYNTVIWGIRASCVSNVAEPFVTL